MGSSSHHRSPSLSLQAKRGNLGGGVKLIRLRASQVKEALLILADSIPVPAKSPLHVVPLLPPVTHIAVHYNLPIPQQGKPKEQIGVLPIDTLLVELG